MSGIVFTNPVNRGQDSGMDIAWIGANYSGSKVVAHCVYTPSGIERDVIFEGPALAAMRAAVPNFNGLRVSMLAYIQSLDATLAGNVT